MEENQDTDSIVGEDESLARFILFSKWIRSDNTIRPDAFIPHPYPDLSVTRHIGLIESQLWEIGQLVAQTRPATLYGRSDIQANAVTSQDLQIKPTPEPKNHANITGWPWDKCNQKIIAQELAAAAHFIPKPK